MQRPVDLVVGKDESARAPNPGRPHLQPPPHWRLEAIAAVERPRDLVVTPAGGVVFILDRDSSDVWHLAARTGTPDPDHDPARHGAVLGGHSADGLSRRHHGRVR